MLDKNPNDVLKNTWYKIPVTIKVTFISVFLFGLLTHLYMFTNALPNHDEAYFLVGNLEWAAIAAGRWFIPCIAAISSIFSLPWVNGLLSLFYIAISACLVVTITKINSKLSCILIAGIMVTFPTAAGIFTYMQHADPYFFSLMLMCFAAFLAGRYKYGYIAAIFPIVFGLAIYQSFFSVITALLILILIFEILDNRVKWQKIIIQALKYLATLSVGMALYILSIKIFYPGGLPGEYQGLNEIGQTSLSDLLISIDTAYRKIFDFFVYDTRNYHYEFMGLLFFISFLICGILVILYCTKSSKGEDDTFSSGSSQKPLFKEPIKLLLLFILLLLFPLACNIIYLMGAEEIHGLMIYGKVFILVFLIVITDLFYKEISLFAVFRGKFIYKATSISIWIVTLILSLTIFNYWIVSNQAYFKLNIGYQTTYAQSILLVSRIQSVPGYSSDMDIIIVGDASIPRGIPELDLITVQGAVGPELFGHWTYPYFLRHYLNFTQNLEHFRYFDVGIRIVEEDEDMINTINIVKEMPVYPNDGSIKIVDDIIYVLFTDIYAD